MYYIVALGNKGDEYANSRHNAGWIVLRQILEACGFEPVRVCKEYKGWCARGAIEGKDVVALFPNTYMNQSGIAAAALVPKREADHLILIYDDIDIPLGELKISYGKGGGGHNGVASVAGALGTKNFVHIRIGIAPRRFLTGTPYRPEGGDAMTKYVLGAFKKGEREKINGVAELAADAVKHIVSLGYESAMNQFNSKS